ncbi:MAG TPA: NAD(P)-binding protein [Candidatus Competibacteraceae bacterium]|nr:NAD(P)-binding protein [Candidatus Competibacteraceae bacterium]HQA24682.1 NAD(P)-binding protein [Candidatus Competibacteraceae bacterium]HQD54931.1 NAD(P)-binding protein [Candidatus Competibacteraceae bacterium]
MTDKPINMTRPLDLTHEKRNVGPQRIQRPIYSDLLPTCNNACPAGENIQAWLALAQEGRFKEAWQSLTENNPMPAIHGRVCYHPCESACNRGKLDASVSIHAVERFLGDMALQENWQFEVTTPTSGKRVLVVGAGPSGLSAAYHLARMGHSVEIHEAGPMAGGMMHFGIPAYRLPRDILDAEAKRIENMGVKIVLNHRVDDLEAEKAAGNFDAIFVAVGAHISKRTEIPARDAGKMLDAVSFLKDVETGNPPKLGRRVAIYGGGNTAMDAARVAKRLGYEPLIIYRRDREHMPAHSFEADEALEEDVKFHWLRTIKNIDQTTFTVEVMEVDEKGRPRPTGQLETLEADALILALGQDVDTSFMTKMPGVEIKSDGVVVVDDQMMTGYPGLFAGGDMVPSDRTVTIGVGHGKKAARHIDAWLRGGSYAKPPKHDLATFDKLHVWYYTDAAQRPQSHLDMKRRISGFEEVVSGLSQKEALYEAKRCLSCGNCYECDGCYGSCPEDAIIKLGPGLRYRHDYDLCTGCAVCFEQCPCHAIEMVPEPAGE